MAVIRICFKKIINSYKKIPFPDILWIQLIFLPWTICKWIYFYTRWFWKFGILKEEYGLEEKLYVIRKFMKLSQTQFDVRIYRIIFFLLGWHVSTKIAKLCFFF